MSPTMSSRWNGVTRDLIKTTSNINSEKLRHDGFCASKYKHLRKNITLLYRDSCLQNRPTTNTSFH